MTKSEKAVMQQALDALPDMTELSSSMDERAVYGYTADQMQAYARAAIAQPVEPALYQFQAEDKSWCSFTDERHYKNTVADGRWPIRALYEHPTTAQPANDKLLQIIAAAYQIAGACDLPVYILDVLADPEKATQEQIDAMLPFVQPTAECNFCPSCGKRLGSIDDVHTCTPPVLQKDKP